MHNLGYVFDQNVKFWLLFAKNMSNAPNEPKNLAKSTIFRFGFDKKRLEGIL